MNSSINHPYNPEMYKNGKCFNSDAKSKFKEITQDEVQAVLDARAQLVKDTRKAITEDK